jgi:hypothetical protein
VQQILLACLLAVLSLQLNGVTCAVAAPAWLFPLPLMPAVLAGLDMQNHEVLQGTVLLFGLTLAAHSSNLQLGKLAAIDFEQFSATPTTISGRTRSSRTLSSSPAASQSPLALWASCALTGRVVRQVC